MATIERRQRGGRRSPVRWRVRWRDEDGRCRNKTFEREEDAPRRRAAVVLRFYLGYSRAETAELLGVTEATVRSLVHRALGDLRARVAFDETAASAAPQGVGDG